MSGKTSTSTSGVSIPPAVLSQYESVTSSANQTAQTPFQDYTGAFVAPVNAEQTAGIQATNTAADSYQPYYAAATGTLGQTQANTTGVNDAATGLAAAGAGAVNATPLTGSQINSYMSPYLNDVLGSTEALQNQSNQQQQAGQLGDAITSGAFGSDRTGIAAANLEEQQNLANNSTIANIANTAYTNAQGVAEQQQGVNLSAAQANRSAEETAATNLAGIGSTAYGEGANTASELGTLGSNAQTAGLAGANAQIAAGTVQQQTAQAQDTAEYNQFLQQQSYPFQVGSWLAGISEGIGTNEGSTTTTTQPGGFFSDKRLKHSIQKIGKTYDGQTIYSYKMGDDPRTRIGLIAQEVEKRHPDAVGLAAGFKMVDYGKATQAAANRGHFREGGVVPFRRVGRAYGGGTDLDAVLQAQQQMYSGLGGGQQQRQMPQQSSGGHGLAIAQAPQVAPKSGISNVSQTVGLANNVNKLSNGSLGTNVSNYAHGYTQAPFGGGANQLNTVTPAGQPMGGVAPSSSATTFAAPDAPVAAPASQVPAAAEGATAGASDAAASGATDAAAGAATDAAAGAAGDAAAGAATGAAAGAGADAAADAAAALAAEYAAADVGTVAVMAARKGGRIHRDVGGGIPYSDDGGAYDIPDEPSSGAALKAAPAAGKQPTGLQTMLYMGNPDNTSSLAGSMFSNEALATGGVAGRRHYDGGGDVAPEPTTDDMPDGGLGDAALSSPSITASGVAPATPDPDGQSWFDKHKGTILPILQGLAAMGTAKTVHPGVALAAGLGAGASSYLDTQTSLANTADIQAKARGQQIANQLNTVKNQAVTDALTGKGPYAPIITPPAPTQNQQPAASPTGAPSQSNPASTASALDQKYRAAYATPTITPQEVDYNNRMNALSAATGNPEWAQMGQKRQAMRFQQQQFANTQAAQHEADGLYQIATSDPDPINRQAATAQYNAIHQFTGDTYENVAGSMRNKRTGQPPIGVAAQTLTPEQSTQAVLTARGQNLGALDVTPDAAGNPYVINKATGTQTAVASGGPPMAPGPMMPPAVGATPQGTAAAQPADNGLLPGVDLAQLPKTIPTAGWVNNVGAVTPMETEKFRATQLADANDAATQDAKTRSIIAAAQHEIAKIPPRAVGPGSDVYNGFQKFRAVVTGSPPDALVDEQTLDKYLNQVGAQNVRTLLAGQKITNQEMMTFMTRGSPNVAQPLATIGNLVNYLGADTDYDARLQATKIRALSPDVNANPYALPGAIDRIPGAGRADYVQSKLGFTPTFTPKQRPVSGVPGSPQRPPVGSVRGGYAFQGGDPSNRANWSKVTANE